MDRKGRSPVVYSPQTDASPCPGLMARVYLLPGNARGSTNSMLTVRRGNSPSTIRCLVQPSPLTAAATAGVFRTLRSCRPRASPRLSAASPRSGPLRACHPLPPCSPQATARTVCSLEKGVRGSEGEDFIVQQWEENSFDTPQQNRWLSSDWRCQMCAPATSKRVLCRYSAVQCS